MRIATWNVNSLRARHDLVLDWLKRNEPDVLCIQETKVTDNEFPSDEFQRLGYAVAMAGQKSYNGVAIASRHLMRDIKIGLEGAKRSDDKRMISAIVKNVHVFSCYVPNGKSLDNPAYQEKLAWLARLRNTLECWTSAEKQVAVCGDFNIAADERDVFDVAAFEGHTHFSAKEHEALSHVTSFGLYDSFRLHEQRGDLFSWWDYRGGAVRRNQGMRIDYVFVSESLKQRCTKVEMDAAERHKDKPSDHIPVVAHFD